MKYCLFFISLIFVFAFTKADRVKKAVNLNLTAPVHSPFIQNGDTPRYATLYVYRRASERGQLSGYNVHIADSVVCRARNDSKYIIKLYKEGPAEIWAKTETKISVMLDVEFGHEYYLKCEVNYGVFAGRPSIRIVASERGKWEFEDTEGLNSKKISSKEEDK